MPLNAVGFSSCAQCAPLMSFATCSGSCDRIGHTETYMRRQVGKVVGAVEQLGGLFPVCYWVLHDPCEQPVPVDERW